MYPPAGWRRGVGVFFRSGQGGGCFGSGKNGTESEEDLRLFLCSLMMFTGLFGVLERLFLNCKITWCLKASVYLIISSD